MTFIWRDHIDFNHVSVFTTWLRVYTLGNICEKFGRYPLFFHNQPWRYLNCLFGDYHFLQVQHWSQLLQTYCSNSCHKGHWCGALMFSLICAWIYGWVNNREAGDLRYHCAHHDVTVIYRTLMNADYWHWKLYQRVWSSWWFRAVNMKVPIIKQNLTPYLQINIV